MLSEFIKSDNRYKNAEILFFYLYEINGNGFIRSAKHLIHRFERTNRDKRTELNSNIRTQFILLFR